MKGRGRKMRIPLCDNIYICLLTSSCHNKKGYHKNSSSRARNEAYQWGGKNSGYNLNIKSWEG